MTTWSEMLAEADLARREGRSPNGNVRFTDAEINAAFAKEFKLPSEWAAGDIIDIQTGTKERQSGCITGPVIDDRVMVLFEDNIHWSFPVIGCVVRRVK